MKSSFPESIDELLLCGPNIVISNPFFKTPKRVCDTQKAFDVIDLVYKESNYLPRGKYVFSADKAEILDAIEKDDDGQRLTNFYRIASRKMIDKNTERTLISCIIPPEICHMDSLYSILIHNKTDLVLVQSTFSSLISDFLVKMSGKSNLRLDILGYLPFSRNFKNQRVLRTLLLNCVDQSFADLWCACWKDEFLMDEWGMESSYLDAYRFSSLSGQWNEKYFCRTEYERRQLLIENDVLNAIAIGLTLDELIAIYRLYFPVLRQYEDDTWYDSKGRIVFTNNRSLSGVGVNRSEWETICNRKEGDKYTHTIEDDTIIDGPIERQITYYPPFRKYNREEDYSIVWANFEKRFK